MKSGFTLVELLITLAIAAILLAVGVPSFSELVKNTQLTTQVNDLVTDLALARSEAVKRAAGVAVCAGTTAGCAGGWGGGWIIFTDQDAGCDYDAGTDEILRVHEGLRGDTAMTAAPGCVGFTGPGYMASNVAQTFTLCNSQLGKNKVITVAPVGHIGITTGSC
jgi:type IV fimbrial biogenesis protein FimT